MFRTFRTILGGVALATLGAVALAADVELPAGEVMEGFVDDKGGVLLVVRRTNDPADGSVGVQIKGKKTRQINLHNISVRHVSSLSNGRLLLSGSEMRVDGSWDAVKQIVGIGRDGDVRRHWKFSSREFDPLGGSHGVPINVSGDGRAWGLVDDRGTGFVFGKTRSGRAKMERTENAQVGAERDAATSEFKWPMVPGFVFLDSEGPVVLTPWSGGAYVLHFAASGSSPLVVPILFEDGVEEYEFRWQWNERVLWARTSLYWKAYDFWDFGFSAPELEPFLVVESSAEPHPERGAIRLTTADDRYRIEHIWRERWSPVEEVHVSDWRSGRPMAFFVSPSGRRSVVVETRDSEQGERRSYATHVELRPASHTPRLEPDWEAEIAADHAAMPWLSAKARSERDAQKEVEEGREPAPAVTPADAERLGPDNRLR